MNNDRFEFTPTGSFITVNQGDGILKIRPSGLTLFGATSPKQYDFTPQADATPLELAWLGHFWAWRVTPGATYPPQHPQWPLISRHFTEI